MKFNIFSKDFYNKLSINNGAIASNPVFPILDSFLIQVEGEKLKVSTTNLKTSIETTTSILKAARDGKAAIPAALLMDTLKNLPNEIIEIEVGESYEVKIKSSKGSYKMGGSNPEDYPVMPKCEDGRFIEIDQVVLSDAIARVLFATSNDDLRPAMTGVLFEMMGTAIRFVATDAHKLALVNQSVEIGEINGTAIVPAETLQKMKNTLKSGTVKIQVTKENAFFEIDNAKYAARLIDSNYPNYSGVVPTNNHIKTKVNRIDFINSLKRISIYANKNTNQVILEVTENEINIKSQDLDMSNEAKEKINCESNESITIAFNAKILIESLKALPSDYVTLETSSPTRAGIIKDENEQDNLILAMPVRMG